MIKAQLKSDWAPKTVANFLKYTDDKYFDGTVFHRIIPNFMVQGGGFGEDFYAGNRNQKSGLMSPIQNEAGVHNAMGTLAMARTNDPNSATSQFFINLVENSFLDKSPSSAGYAVFGTVISGMDLVQSMGVVSTGNVNGMADVPDSPVVLRSVRRVPC
jgi:cyclophilin family peptidyl-prolyl cis-trans isomerase